MKQATFASLAFDRKKKQTRRERFLSEMALLHKSNLKAKGLQW